MDIREWNCRLNGLVFHDRVDLSPEIRRIDATNRFLAAAGGFEHGSDARRSFLEAMPRTESGVRGLFEDSVMRQWTSSADDLPFYAQLHLTILAASADESLQDQGNFRVRLGRMLGLDPKKDYVSSGCLPALWENAQRWSLNRSERRCDTRRLILPDPGVETIIGYSKRLAFPGFRDQNHLAELFSRKGVDASSPLSHLINAFRSELSGFSDRFSEEFRRFTRLVDDRDRLGALRTPFWDAVVETTWTRARNRGPIESVGCRLEIDPTDPFDPEIWFYCPQSVSAGPGGWIQAPGAILEHGLVCWRHDEAHSAGKIFDVLRARSLRPQERALLGDGLGRALGEGCVGFVLDDEGRWWNTPWFPDAGVLWLVLHRTNYQLLEAPTGSHRNATVSKAPLLGSSAWTLFGPIDVNDATRDWFEARASTLNFCAPRLVRRRITGVGSWRQPDGAYLHLPPVIPAVRCADARSGVATVESKLGESSFPLLLRDDRLVVPENKLREAGRENGMRVVVFDGAGEEISRARFRFCEVSSALGFKVVRTPAAWLESGLEGRLKRFSPDPAEGLAEDRRDCEMRSGRVLLPLARSDSSLAPPVTLAQQDLDGRCTRTTEILSAVFARRYAWPVNECENLLASLWGSRGEAVARLEDLIANGMLRRLHTRHWSNVVVVAGQPVVVVHGSGSDITVRIVGLLSSAMREVVGRVLGEQGRVVASPDRLTGGALQCHLNTVGNLSALHAETGWPLRAWDALPKVCLPTFQDLFATSARLALEDYIDEEKTTWSPRLNRFLTKETSIAATPRLERWRARRQQDLYVLYRRDGAIWNTDCRTWALLALAAEGQPNIGYVLADGTVRLQDACLSLPSAIAWRTVAGGGGVCFRDPDMRRVYTASTYWAPASGCASWFDDTALATGHQRSRQTARDRYAVVRERERMSRTHYAAVDADWL